MNVLCRAIEDVDFDIKFAKDANNICLPKVSKLPTYEEKYGATFDPSRLALVKRMYQRYNSRKQIKQLSILIDNVPQSASSEDFLEIRHNMFEAFIAELQSELVANHMDGSEFLFYVSRLAPTYNNFNYGFAWDVLEDQIISLIPQGHTYCPVRDPAGEEYLGNTYKLVEVSDTNELLLQVITNLLFGVPESLFTLEEIQKIKQEQKNYHDTTTTGEPAICGAREGEATQEKIKELKEEQDYNE